MGGWWQQWSALLSSRVHPAHVMFKWSLQQKNVRFPVRVKGSVWSADCRAQHPGPQYIFSILIWLCVCCRDREQLSGDNYHCSHTNRGDTPRQGRWRREGLPPSCCVTVRRRGGCGLLPLPSPCPLHPRPADNCCQFSDDCCAAAAL